MKLSRVTLVSVGRQGNEADAVAMIMLDYEPPGSLFVHHTDAIKAIAIMLERTTQL